MLNLIGYGEHAGSGVPDIFQAWKDAGLNAPIVEEMFGGGTLDRTILTLPLETNFVTNLVNGDEAGLLINPKPGDLVKAWQYQ